MKVFFGTTTKELQAYLKYYEAIRMELIKLNCVINYDWLAQAVDTFAHHISEPRGMNKIVSQVIKAIKTSDFTVIEYSVPNFSSSHQILYSLQRRKPTLVLRLKKDNVFVDSYLEHIDSDLLVVKDYNLKSLSAILQEFIGLQSLEQQLKRYNLVLDGKHKYYLDWATHTYNQSRSEIVRQAVDHQINTDKKFKQYLRSDRSVLN